MGVAFNDLVLPEGEYGISVSGEPAPDVPYLLRFDVTIEPVASFESEPNDAVAFANPFDISGDEPTIQGRLSGANYDIFRLTVTGEPQLWEITGTGPGIGRMDVLNAVGSSDVTGTLVDGTSTINDVYLLPGDHFISIQGSRRGGGGVHDPGDSAGSPRSRRRARA